MAASTYTIPEHVVQRIVEERTYQRRKGADHWAHEDRLSLTEELLLIRHYADMACSRWCTDVDDEPVEVLHNLRRLLAIVVRCAEQHPLPSREQQVKNE